MKLEMTQKDKNLLIMLSIFVIVVCIGYWGIYPVVKEIIKTDKEMDKQVELQSENEMKLVQVPMLEADNASMNEKIQTVRKSFFPMMDSSAVDKYFTGLVLGYNLESYDLSIEMPQDETTLQPYVYSKRAQALENENSDETTEEPQGAKAEQAEIDAAEESGGMSDDSDSADADFGLADTEPVTTGICNATVTMRLGGDEKNLQQLIEDLSNSEKKIRVCNYSWSEERSVSNLTEDGEYDIDVQRVLTITLEIYMYKEVPDDGDAE